MKKFFILILFFISGCGYTTRSFVYKEDKIFIFPVNNKIEIASEKRAYSDYRSFPLFIEKRLTSAIVNDFNIDGRFKVSKSEVDSLKLISNIYDYRKENLRYTKEDSVGEQRLRLYVHITLISSDDKILKEKDIVGETSYFLSGPKAKTETEAWNELIKDTSRRILEAVIEEW